MIPAGRVEFIAEAGQTRERAAMRIALLGPLQVRDEAGTPVSIGGRQLRVLFILLALAAGRVVPAGTLTDELWPAERPADPGNALQTLVSRLRAALRAADCAALLESHPAGYRLAVPADAVDALQFQALAVTGRRALAAGDAPTAARMLREALGLWRGPALADAAGCEAAEAAAVSLGELREGAAQDRIEAELGLGEAVTVIGELKSMVSADPLAERPRALLMRALAAAGRQAEALATYTEARELLADQLGVDPSPALEQVYLRVLRGEEAPSPQSPGSPGSAGAVGSAGSRPPRAVPVPVTSFVGRDDELSRLLKLLRESAWLVTLTGPGGVGKTRLATEALGSLDARACFVPLAPVTDPVEVPYAVLDALGIRGPMISRRTGESDPSAGPLDRLTAALAGRDDVLILDNCEHVIEAAAAVAARVLADCPRARIVTTSREPLRIDGETLCPVRPLAFPPPADLFPATYASVRLLADRAAAVQPGFQVDDGNAEAIARICRTLDGMPLAIELAAVWLRMLSPAQLAERLADRFALLTGGSRTALPRHQTLRAVVDWSWDLLSEPERVLARRLSVFPGGAPLPAAERVCAGDELPTADVLASLSGLVGKSILTVAEHPDDAGPRYRMLETVRAYCLERLSAAGEARQIRDAFSEHYLTLVETADPLLRAAGQRRWLRELVAEQDNIYGALRWLIASRDVTRALRLIRSLSWYWMLRGQAGEPATLADEVLALGPGPRTLQMAEARVICALMAAGPAWDIDRVRDDLATALAELAEWSADWPSFHPIAALGEPVVALFDGDPERALTLLNRFDAAADPWVRASAGMLRASFAGLLGFTAHVEDDVRRALAAFRELGEAWGMAGALLELAKFAGLRGDHAVEAAALEEAVELGRELGAWGDLPQIDAMLASVRIRMGDLAGAREDLERAERGDVGFRVDRPDSAAYLSVVRAELACREGDHEQAARHYGKTLDWLGGQKSAWYQAWRAQLQARLAVVLLESGEADRSRALLADSLRAAAVWIDRAALADVINGVAVFALRDDAALAATLLGVAHTIRSEFDEGGLDGPGVRQAAREGLGLPGFEAAYQRGRDLSFSDGLRLAADVSGADLADIQPGQVLRR
jgi:predicted ATPase/DNA-binding SARP family transcriptional activator